MITERYEYIDAKSSKFWQVKYPEILDTAVRWWEATWGRIGTQGQGKQFFCKSSHEARRQALAKIDEKIAKGYDLVHCDHPPKPLTGPTIQPQPIIKVQASHADDDYSDAETDSLDTRNAVLALLAAGFNSKQISQRLSLNLGRVRAIAAHNTMGRYESPIKNAVGSVTKTKSPLGGRRRFQLDD